ncbi:MAG: 4Fe-4S dicluster domain-containing protein, partial [Oscillospiraceae bacterium]|nr:4Fe-4S dicluster domain-containing protein [Oscillospiraceae bacterium]
INCAFGSYEGFVRMFRSAALGVQGSGWALLAKDAELSRCIRCNACRDACPACTCEKCVFDNPNSGVENKSPANSFEEKLFHIIRAYHVAGRCTDCGECSRVCPQNIPLHLLNRKFIKDMNEFYGEYQAGEEVGMRAPLVNYTTEDLEPGEVFDRRDK